MPSTVTCECGRRLEANDEHAGKRVKCPSCGKPLEVPAPKADEAATPANVEMMSFDCPSCNLKLVFPDKEAGTQKTCPDCGATVTVPAAPTTSRVEALHLRLLPGVGALLGVVVALFIASIGRRFSEGFWSSLHGAHVGYLQGAGSISGLAVPIGALAGLLAFRTLVEEKARRNHEDGKHLRVVLTTWLAVAPALHWFASLFLLLYASRYTPDGGKIIPILYGLFHVLLLALSISAGVCLIRRSTLAHGLLLVYLSVLIVALALPTISGLPTGYLHLMPFIFWLPPPAVIATGFVLYLGIGVAAVLVGERRASWSLHQAVTGARSNGVAHRAVIGAGSKRVLLTECTGLLLASLSLLAYFLTSQFDTRSTGPLTHCLLVALAGVFTMGAMYVEHEREIARTLLWTIAPTILALDVLILFASHSRG